MPPCVCILATPPRSCLVPRFPISDCGCTHFPLTYESAMTRLFRDGRTETIRSLSNASVAFVKAMLSPKESNDSRIALLKKAADQHQVTTTRDFLLTPARLLGDRAFFPNCCRLG
jgi:hypothetical protein